MAHKKVQAEKMMLEHQESSIEATLEKFRTRILWPTLETPHKDKKMSKSYKQVLFVHLEYRNLVQCKCCNTGYRPFCRKTLCQCIPSTYRTLPLRCLVSSPCCPVWIVRHRGKATRKRGASRIQKFGQYIFESIHMRCILVVAHTIVSVCRCITNSTRAQMVGSVVVINIARQKKMSTFTSMKI